jgi:hypothetical protein
MTERTQVSVKKITHGRHCTCGACASEDWTNPALAPCGMHGSSCPREYQPLGKPGMYEEGMSVDLAVDLVAAALLSEEIVELEWQDAPLVGEHDFERIQAAGERIQRTLMPDVRLLAEAHRFLEARAGSGE